MNWRVGLFRLWVVCAVLWIVASALILRPDTAIQGYVKAKADLRGAFDEAKSFDMRRCEEWRTAPPRSGVDRQTVGAAIACYRYMGKSEGEETAMERTLNNMGWSKLEVQRTTIKVYNASYDAFEKLGRIAMALLMPPALLLALGAAVVWALSGFRR